MSNCSEKPAVFFDMDGTLLDLAYDDFIWNELLPVRYAETHGCSLEQSRATLYTFYQQHNHTLNWYSSSFWTAKVGVDVLAMQIEHKHKVALRPYCLELLDYLKSNDYPIWLTTNADCASLAFKLEQMNLKDYFDVIVSSESIGHAKEFVEFWQGLNALHPFNPEQVYFIDDTEKVLNGARAYGIQNLFSIQQPSSGKVARKTCNYPMLHQLTELITHLNQTEVSKQYA
ncbi:HAD-IA family hydrolase [Acinetobacter bohemicus]|uniref:HAD-IA family hydrolase n=1 Tax=Acinetobacter sp. S4397-1 TaxID=2972915 RepID=UPI00209AC332|nr:HAD-IA family hydrolase [Acinetobacter sp. S4397-1]MCO8045391.1 HAD-IA family hydrolase [Acinetobacter sp. S4397-1]